MLNFLQLSCLFWLLLLLLLATHALAATAADGLLQQTTSADLAIATFITKHPQDHNQGHNHDHDHHLESRQQQSAGSSCSDEGQWNCMTSSWQRCAAGRWSVVMQCARGTACHPAGLAREMRIQHDGSASSNGGPPMTSRGARSSWVSSMGMLGWWVLGWCLS
ncbi:hypothetical protein BBO_08789 [Beauveria brongniartii RCEF 3172]|uniref:Uncharacterized protein n=1 Tax=Beauveria brongniartii RCEF 3172 TaxID=1081107 RepID=A0A166X2W0_9HYPO|nr:hypothetical protein BBO_08789 [Beauveria brongniartii RCEF 3172]